MRKGGRTGVNLSALITAHERVPDRELDGVTQLHVNRDGTRAARYLVWKERARFHRTGEVDFVVPQEEQTPSWFRVAIEFLKRRKGWSVVTFKRGGANDGSKHRVYRVTWHAHAYYAAQRDERWNSSN